MNKSGNIWQGISEGEEEEETEEQQAAGRAKLVLCVKRRDAVDGLRAAAFATERAFAMLQDAFLSSLMESVEHQRGVEESTRMLERVVVPLRQVMTGPLFSRVGAMSHGVGVVLPLRQVMAGPLVNPHLG